MPFDVKNGFVPPLDFIDIFKPDNYAKNDFLREFTKEVTAKEFYRDIFTHHFENEGIDTSKSTGIGNMMCINKKANGKLHTDIITEEFRNNLDVLYKDNDCALIPLVTFY